MKIFFLLINLFLITIPFISSANAMNRDTISSTVAISQTGRFAVSSDFPLKVDKNESLNLINFLAFQDLNSNNSIIIGAISGDSELKEVCRHPVFLKNENLGDIVSINESDIQYINTTGYNGCIININKDKSAFIIARPVSFINQEGQKIKNVCIIGPKQYIASLTSRISFDISAKDFFINLLQISQAFSPFNKEINWDNIKNQGLEFIGEEAASCRGLLAAAKFLIPALNKIDFHSFVSLKGLGSTSCPTVPIPEDENMKRWLSTPEKTKNLIRRYTANFHGYVLNNHISYIYIPAIFDAFSADAINKQIATGRATLTKANIDESCGLIVDLRFNLGGSLQSMLLALGGVISSGKLFNLGEISPIYLSDNGNILFYATPENVYGQYSGSEPHKIRNKPIAILTNWMTGSSGAITSLALRDNASQTQVFGTETSLTTSVNATFYLLDGNTLNLMVDRIYSNKGDVVPLRLPVDEIIEDNLETIYHSKNDVVLNAAIRWLESLPICRPDLTREAQSGYVSK